MFVKPTRSALVRTRLDAEAIREALADLVAAEQPEGMKGFLAHGYFFDGSVDDHEFHASYHYNAQKNPQTYDVRGLVQKTPDWRIVRLTIRAQAPWMSAGRDRLHGVVRRGRRAGWRIQDPDGDGSMLLVLAIYGSVNLVFIPDKVLNRVAAHIATLLRGSVQVGRTWVVPDKDD